MLFKVSSAILVVASVASAASASEFKILEGHKVQNSYYSPLPYTYIQQDDLPDNFSWGNVGGIGYLTKSLNQHIPGYCGSCWAHGALSSLADRIKIARNATGDEINLSIQYILNCAGKVAGSCHGGSHTGVYEFIKETGFIPYDSCMPYIACSSESNEGFCKHVDTTCSAINTCRTCDTFGGMGGSCSKIDVFPNASIAEYGTYNIFQRDKMHLIMAEIYARGPVAAAVNAEPLLNYKGGIVKDTAIWKMLVNHIVSIVGWGTEEETGDVFWIVRNSWGEYWGEMGFFNILAGHNSLGIESEVAWATVDKFTLRNFPCGEDATDCGKEEHTYIDPSVNTNAIKIRLATEKSRKVRGLETAK